MTWHKTSRQERGYGREWEVARLQALKRDHFTCQCPNCQGGKLRLRPASQVHHIRPKAADGTNALDNLMSVHPECHHLLGLAERGCKPKQRYDRNGRRIK